MQNETTEFLKQLWGGKPDDLYVLIWTRAGKKSAWFRDTADAARYIADGDVEIDVYVGVGLSKTDRGEHARCPADEIVGIAGMWADVDYEDGKAHKSDPKKLPLPPDGASARKIIEAVGLRPTLIVHSGHGLQAWWLLKEPLIFDDEVERKAAAIMARLWQKNIGYRASLFGWSVDSVPDLARLLRVPGTQNWKTDVVAVRFIKADGPWYTELSDFEEVLLESPSYIQSQAGLEKLSRGRDYWRETVQGVIEGDRNNRMTSFAGKLFSIVGDIDDQMAAYIISEVMLIVNDRNKPPLSEHEVRNSWQSIWKKEKAHRAGLEAQEIFDDQNEDMLSKAGTQDKKMEFIRKHLGDLPIREITKRGKHNSEYVCELQNGMKIILGNILNQDAVRKSVLDATGGDGRSTIVPIQKKIPWTLFCGRMSALARQIETLDADRNEQVYEWLQDYLNNAQVVLEDQWKSSLIHGHPFQRDEMIFINVKHFHHEMRFNISVKSEYLRSGLIDLGFKSSHETGRVENVTGLKRVMSKRFWHTNLNDLNY